jgi:hypothetical protein
VTLTLPDDIDALDVAALRGLVERAKTSDHVQIVTETDGRVSCFRADWLKHLVLNEQPSHGRETAATGDAAE